MAHQCVCVCVCASLCVYRRYTWADLDEYTPDPVVDWVMNTYTHLPPKTQESVAKLGFTAMPIQLHAMVFALFASLIAPFGEMGHTHTHTHTERERHTHELASSGTLVAHACTSARKLCQTV